MTDDYISIFGLDHLIYIAGLVILACLLFYFRHNIKNNRNIITLIILFISICQQILLYSSYFVLMEFDLSESLPLHISRINSLIGIIYLITKNEKVFKVLCFFSLYAWTSFIYPSRVYAITHPLGVSFFINHVITLLLPFYAMIVYGAIVTKKDKYKAFLWFVAYLFIVILINPIVNGNYFYLKYKPVFPTLSDWIYIPGVLVVTYALFYLGEKIFMKVQNLYGYLDR